MRRCHSLAISLYSPQPKIAIVHQMVKEIFYYEFEGQSADLGSLVEKMIYKTYTDVQLSQFLTASQ